MCVSHILEPVLGIGGFAVPAISNSGQRNGERAKSHRVTCPCRKAQAFSLSWTASRSPPPLLRTGRPGPGARAGPRAQLCSPRAQCRPYIGIETFKSHGFLVAHNKKIHIFLDSAKHKAASNAQMGRDSYRPSYSLSRAWVCVTVDRERPLLL